MEQVGHPPIAITSALALFGQRLSAKLRTTRSSRRRAKSADLPELYPASRLPEALTAFYGGVCVAGLFVAFGVASAATVVILGLQGAGAEPSVVDALGRPLWSVWIGLLAIVGYAAFRVDISEHPNWEKHMPSFVRAPSDWHLLIAPLMGVPCFFVMNPFLLS